MITIYNKSGSAIQTTKVLQNLPITKDCQHVEEMMKDDYVSLSWRDTKRYTLPVGSYIMPYPDETNPYDAEDTRYPIKYRLLEDYSPEGRTEQEFAYEPHFQHPIMWLSRLPFILTTGNVSTWADAMKKTSWGYTGSAGHIAGYIVDCINWYASHNTLFNTNIGSGWYAQIDADLPASATVNFEGLDIFSAASQIAQAFDCEFHFDYAQCCFHLGKIQYGTNVVLKSGQNVGVASVTRTKSDFHNAFLIKGSTKNLSQPTDTGENAQVRERLTLNPTDYPDGVMYTNDSGTVITKAQFDLLGVPLLMEELVFDGIFPKLQLYLYNVRERKCYLLDEFGEKVTDALDPTGYKTYSKWYIRLAYPLYNSQGTITEWVDYTIGENSIIDGQTLGITFFPNTKQGAKTSLMIGQGDFDLVYFDTQTTEKEADDINPAGFTAQAGDYRIVFKDGTPIIPTTSNGGIYPQGEVSPSLNGNIASLINVVVDEDYKKIAQTELETTAIRKVQQERMDLNNYVLRSYPDYFEENEVTLHLGQSVTYNDGGDLNGGTAMTLDTHIIKIVSQLDMPFEKEITVGNEKIQGNINTIKDDVQNIVANIGSGTDLSDQQLERIIKNYGSQMFLSKKNDDTAQGFIRFIKGLQVGEQFTPGPFGQGGVFRRETDGSTYIEADTLYIRLKAYFDTVEIRKFLHTGGNRIATVAGAKCSRVDWIDANGVVLEQTDANLPLAVKFRCYFRAKDGDNDVKNDFVIGDQAYCHVTKGQAETMEQASEGTGGSSLTTKHYWRLVIGRNPEGTTTEDGDYWIDLSNHYYNGQPANMSWVNERGETVNHPSHQAGSDIPAPQDDIVQLGSADDTTRQGAIVEFVTGGDSPSYQIFQGIDEYSFVNKNYISFGYSTQTGRAYMNVYGDFFFGAKEDPTTHESPTYIKYDSENEEMTIKAVVEFQNPDDPTQTTTLDDFASAVVSDISNIQSQIDGEIDTWFYEGTPALNNLPASNWATDTEKDKHLGDLYYDIGSGATAGFAYRFIKTTVDNVTTYSWQYIDDTAITEALRQAAKAQDTADNKRRVFVAQPVATSHDDGNYVEYDVGDLWANATGTFTYVDDGQTKTVTYDNDLLRCRVSKPIRNASGVVIDGTFSITDWELATRYTDDTKIDAFLDGYQGTLTTIRNQVDKKAETYYQDDDPSTNQWGSEHVGDMWFCTSNHTAPSLFQKGTTWIWQEVNGNYVWSQAEIPQIVFDTLDGKKAVYVAWDTWYITNEYGQSVSNLALRDLLIPATDITPQGSSITYYANRIYRCTNLNPITFQEVSYVDEQAWSNWIQNTYNSDMSSIEGQIDHKAETWYQNTNPENSWDDEKSHHVGDLWLVNIDVTGSQIYKAGTTWYYKDNGVGADPRYTWEKQVVPQEVFDYADGKAAIFVGSTLPTNYHVNDMWFIGDGVADANLPTGCIAGDVVVSSTESTTYNKSHWAKKDRYTDDSKFNGYITQIINGTSDTSDSAQVAQALHVIKAALNENTSIDGGLILTSLISLRSNNQVWAGISGLYDATKLGSGIASWYGGLMKDYEALTDAQKNQGWSVQKWAKSLFRFDGSGYLADGNIRWTSDGKVYLSNLYTGSDSPISNLFFDAFAIGLDGTTSYINPQFTFNHIDIVRRTGIGDTITDTSVLNYGEMKEKFVPLAFFNALFAAFSIANPTSSTTPINPTTWTAQTVINNLKIKVGTWTDEYLSAKGLNSSGGSGGVGDVTWDLLANSSDTRPIALSHLTTALSSYATQSWVSSQGYLTSIPTASSSTKGGVKVGNTLAISSEVLNLASVIITAPATGDTTYTKVYVDGYGRVTKATTLSATDIPSLAASKITSGEFDAARIPNLSWTKITTDKPTTLSGYGITDGVKNDTTWWGRSISGGAVKGSIEKATSLEFDNIGSSANNGGYIDFHYNGDNTSNSGDYTSRIIEDQSGIIKINNTLFAKLSGGVTIGTSTVGSNYKLEVSGEIGLTGSTKRIYFSDMNHYIELDSNGYFHFSHGLYSDSFVSAKGLNSNSGSSITLNEPLNGINNAGLSAPTSSAAGQTVVWNGSAWTYSINTTLMAGNLDSAGGATIYGNIISSAGSASIYGNIDSSTGKLRMQRNGGAIQFYLDSTYGYTTAMRVFTGSTTLSLGYETAHDASYDTNIYGYNIGLIYGNSSGYGIFINSSGNVGIGITTNNTYKLQVKGTAFASSFMVAEIGTAYRLPHKIKLNNSFYYSDSNGMVDLGTVGGGGSGDLSNYVTLNTNQEITAFKSFSGAAYIYGISYQNLFVGTTNQAKIPCLAFFESSTGTQNTYGGLCMRSENGSLYRYTKNVASTYTIWDSGNDGSGSSLDADLLDGQHGSYYATASDVTTLQGYFTSGVANSAKRLAQSSDGVTSLSSFIHSTDLIYMAAGGGNTIADKPSGVTAFGALSFKVATGFYGQILYATNGHMYIRESDTLSGGWTEIITSAIIGSQTVSTASKLSTVSQTLFGNTYWTSGGVPTSIGYDSSHRANLWYVADISMKGSITIYDSKNNDFAIFWREANDCIDMYAYENGYHNMCLGMASSTTDGLYFDGSSQRWGIGTHSPSQKLEVNGDVKANNFRGALIGNADTATTATTASKLSAVSKTAWGRTYWTSDGVPDSISGDIDNAANVTMSGYLKMQRNGGAIQFYLDSTNGYTTAMRVFTGSNSLSLGYETAGLGYETIIYGDNVQLHYGTSRALGFYLNSAGNVGIGTSSPSAKIDVNGSANVSGDLTVNGGNINISNNKYIYWKDSDGTSRTAIFLSDSNNFRVGYGMASAGYDTILSGNNVRLTYGTSRSDGLTLTSSGDVGIGVSSPYTKLDVNGGVKATKVYLYKPNSGNDTNAVYFEYDTRNSAVKLNGNFYATGAVSALGANTSSGTVTFGFSLSGTTLSVGSNQSVNLASSFVALSGNQTISGAKTFNGSVIMSADIYPAVTSQYYVGTSSHKFLGANIGSVIINSSGETINGSLTVNGTSYFSGNAVFGNMTISNTSGSGTAETKLETSLAVLRLKAASSVYANNTVISSDMRLKYIRSYANASIDQIANAPVFNFVFTDSPQYIHLGTSAQYWQTIFPCGVSEMPDTYLAMDYGATALAAAVITARRVQNHEDRIRELEYENERLRNEIEMLKAA